MPIPGSGRSVPLCLLIGLVAGAAAAQAPSHDRGLTFRVYRVAAPPERLPAIAPNQTPNADVLVPAVTLADAAAFPPLDGGGPIVVVGLGWIELAAPTTATFRLTSDDGSRLSLGGRMIIDHDGRHGATARTSEPIELAAGLHPIRLDYFDGGGKRTLLLEWKRDGEGAFTPVDASVLRADPDLARVSSPGIKNVVDPRRPGDGKPVAGVHPAFDRSTARPDDFHPKVGALGFLPDGRMVVGTFDPLQRDEEKLPDITAKAPDRLYAIRGYGPGETPTVTPIADGLYEPCGVCVVDGELYVSHRLAITRLSDRDGDGFFEHHQDVASGWEGWNYHQFTFGLVHRPGPAGSKGHLYATLSTAMAPPAWEGMGTNAAPNGVGRGTVLEVDLDSEDWRVIAGGVRTPNGIGVGPEGTLVYCDNQGTWFPASTLSVVEPGRFFGHFNNTNRVPKLVDRFPDGGHASVYADRVRADPAVYFPQNDCGNSPTQPVLVERGPWAGQLLVGDVTQGGLHRVALERVGGQWQGVVFRCTQGLECGSNRLAWGPDGALYIGGIGAGGNWNWNGTQFGLDRLAFNGRTAFEMLDVDLVPGGFEIRFSKPVDPAWLADPKHFALRSWRYEPTAAYGGPKVGERAIVVTRAEPSATGDRVRLTCEGLEAGTCVHLRLDPVSREGEPIWSTDAWYTLNRLANSADEILEDGAVGLGAVPPPLAMPLVGRSSDVALVTREDPRVSRSDQRSQAELLKLDGILRLRPTEGDRITKTTHRSARLHVEWRSTDGVAEVRLQDALPLIVKGTPNAWHSLDAWFEAGDPKRDAGIRYRIDGGETVTQPLGPAAPPGPLAFIARAVETEVRNAWIAPVEAPAVEPGPWTSLIGESLDTGWVVRGGEASFRIVPDPEGNRILGTSVPNSPNTFLVTERSYRDFELLVEVKQHAELNSGIQIRSAIEGGPGSRRGKLIGYQCELDPSERSYSAGIYDEARRGWLAPLTDAPAAREAYRRGEWNRIRIVAQGPVIRTWINGIPAATLLDEVDREGVIALQVHGVGKRLDPLTVEWRRLRIRELR